MKTKRFPFLALALWELTRLVLLVIILSVTLLEFSVMRTETVILLLLLGSGNLLVPAVALSIFIRKKTDAHLVLLLVSGKCIELFTCAVSILAVFSRLFQALPGPPLPVPLRQAMLLFVIFLIDLIFLAILLSLKEERKKSGEPSATTDTLPDVAETEIPDDSP